MDVQERMLEGLRRRARRAGMLERIDARLVEPGARLLPDGEELFDLAVLIAVVHELPDPDRIWRQVAAATRSGGKVIFVEPGGHVSADEFAKSAAQAQANGLRELGPIHAYRSRGLAFERT